jgi:hypothetical protein
MWRPGPGRPPRRGVVELDARSLRRRGAGQRLGAPPGLPGNLDAPPGEVVVDLELDRGELDTTHVVDQLGECARPAAGVAAEDRLERLALALVGPLVDEEPHRRLGLAGPDVALERAHSHDVQPIQLHVTVAPLAHVPGEDAVAFPVVGCWGEGAAAGHPAPADVEPVSRQPPARNPGHRFLLEIGAEIDPFTPSAGSTPLRRAPDLGLMPGHGSLLGRDALLDGPCLVSAPSGAPSRRADELAEQRLGPRRT